MEEDTMSEGRYPIQKLLLNEYIPLKCGYCGKDLLETADSEGRESIVVLVTSVDSDPRRVFDIYWSCKGNCDEELKTRLSTPNSTTSFEDISDLLNPIMLLNWVFDTMDKLRYGRDIYEDEAYEKEKEFIAALSQRVFQEITDEDRKNAQANFDLPGRT